MNVPICPVNASPQEINLDQDLIQKFQKAFHAKTKSIPATIGAVALQGAFEIINGPLKADWRKLLHVSQTFDFLAPITPPMKLIAQTTLKDVKSRAQMHFLNFETQLIDIQTKIPVMSSRSTLIVRNG